MRRKLILSLKAIGVPVVGLLVVALSTDTELAIHVGTVVLVLAASTVFFFAKSLSLRAQAAGFLVLSVAISHAVDRYFWIEVWEHGYPWPYSHSGDCANCGGFIGSIAPFMNEVSVVSFAVLAAIAVMAVAWHLTLRSTRPARQAAQSG